MKCPNCHCHSIVMDLDEYFGNWHQVCILCGWDSDCPHTRLEVEHVTSNRPGLGKASGPVTYRKYHRRSFDAPEDDRQRMQNTGPVASKT